eukprot:TRINITY_DN2733_c2_g1_i1.p1 TRINITY_DN2733_c2_g1~~TRINITY_DN2733_c2_g1_i1.p1  ORF type:complete len:329 (+),score=73.82 TRINITY_DN2733_c2_g1_i1:85-987(+)
MPLASAPAVRLLVAAGAVSVGGSNRPARAQTAGKGGSGGLLVFLRNSATGESQPVELDPDATLAEFASAAGLRAGTRLLFQGQPLSQPGSTPLADLGIASQSVVELDLQELKWDPDQCGSTVVIEDDGVTAHGPDREGGAVLGTLLLHPGVTEASWKVTAVERGGCHKNQFYFGVVEVDPSGRVHPDGDEHSAQRKLNEKEYMSGNGGPATRYCSGAHSFTSEQRGRSDKQDGSNPTSGTGFVNVGGVESVCFRLTTDGQLYVVDGEEEHPFGNPLPRGTVWRICACWYWCATRLRLEAA